MPPNTTTISYVLHQNWHHEEHIVVSCREWNKQANELWTKLGPQVEFFSGTDQMNEDSLTGIHYTEAQAPKLGTS